jgi:hopanoid biosynthesis associated RND transporter like protein HpnN
MRVKPLSDSSFVARILAALAGAIVRRRRAFLYPQLVLLVLCVVYTAKYLQFDTSRNDLIGANKKYHQNFLKFKKEFPTQDDLVVVVESADHEKSRQFVERLGAKLEAEPKLFHDVFYKGDPKMMGRKALLFFPESDLKDLNQTLKDYRPFLNRFTHTTNLVSLFNMVCSQVRTAKRETNAENQSLVKALPALERIVKQATDSLHHPGTPPSPGITALFDAGEEAEQEMYVTFGGGRIYLVTAQAPTEDLNDDAVDRIRQLVAETKVEVPGLNVGLTGEPVLELDEMAQSKRDTTLASIVSLVLCALIFIYGYQETGRPVKATLCLIVGLGYTLAFATLTIGHLNILTITFVPILIGLAIDYGVHLISRYEEELRHGKSPEAALTKAMVFTGQGILSGAFTTAGAFLAMGFTDFKGIQEMGIICGGGLLVCLVPMMTMLPVLLLSGGQNVVDHAHASAAEKRARIENLWLQRPGLVVGIIVVLCALAATQIGKVYFDYNLLNMQSAGLPAVEFEKDLITATNASSKTNSSPKSVLYAAIIATNLAQAVAFEQQLTNLPAVAGVESMSKYLAENPTRKLALIAEVKKELCSVHFDEPDAKPVDLTELSRALYAAFGYFGTAADQVRDEDPALSKQLNALCDAIEALRKELFRGNAATEQATARKLADFQQALFQDVRDTFRALETQDDTSPLRVQDLPPSLRDRFIGVTGKYLLMVNPRKDVWNRENQRELLEQLAQVDPDATGTPVQLYHYTDLLKYSYEQAAWYSLGAIAVLVFLHFRSLALVLLALVPVAVGSLWLGGLMGWLHVPLNPANIMTLPLVIGIGVTNGIHILNRYAEEQTPGILAHSTGKAVLVSGLTAMAGFGSLILARHQGIRSLGCVMTAGLATCMIAGLTFLPALLNVLMPAAEKNSAETEQPSVDNARSTLGREEPR